MAKGTIQGRLNREPNPMPGEKPGFTPQYINDDGYAVDVTPETPYPVGNYVIKNGVWVPWDGSTQLTGRNVLLQSATGVNVSAGSFLVAIGPAPAENISGIYVLVRADASHKYRVRVDHHRETASTFSKFSGDVDALPSAERLYAISDIIKPVGYRFGILVYNESEEDHIYDVEVRSE